MKLLTRYIFISLISVFGFNQSVFAQANIIKVEYFIDTDPGVGAATPIPPAIIPNTIISESFLVPTSALTVGFHTVYFRTQDENLVWGVPESRSFYVSASNLTTQANIVDVEYFIDTDPGYGNGTSLGAFSSATLTLNPTIPTGGLPAGFHVFYTRSLDSDGVWGNLESRSFYVSQSDLTSTATIVETRYYIDTDPGYGNGTLISITTGTTINVSTTIPTSALLDGHHVLHIRSLDSDGVWSEMESRSFYVDAYAAGLITGIEYFYDTDPGFSNGSNFPIAPAVASIDQVVDLPTTALTAGTHELGIRMINENGVYGMTEYYSVTLCDVAVADFAPDVVCIGTATSFAELSTGVLGGDIYSWDFDNDGFEDSNTTGDQSFTYSSSGTIDATLTIDRAGCISTSIVSVQVEPIAVSNAGLDQSICLASTTLAANTLAANESGNWQLVSGTATITTPSDPLSTITAITTESVELSWTVTNSLGGCSAIDNVIIDTSVLLNASFSATSVCAGTPTDFTDNSMNVLGTDTYSWDFDGNATEDASTAGNQSFTFASGGTYNASVTINRGVCISTNTVVVDVFDLPIINAGLDQSICSQSTTLEGNTLAPNETGSWQIISGSGTLGNSSDPISGLDNITSNTIELSWTITNSATSCTSVDNVIIGVNLPITANAVAATVDIGQSIVIDILSSATTNAGDVLTPTIITSPTNGVATILTDNTISYTPNEDASDTDTFTFRITNQCSNTSDSDALITINNQPPVIDEASFTTTTNAQMLSFDLTTLISDPNNNLDFSSLRIVSQPISGAVASIDASGILTIDYTGVTYSGDDQFEIEICDLVGVCAVQTIIIPGVEVGGENPPIKVFNAVSPNGDGFHDFLEIENIEFYPNNTVIILNRWGAEVSRLQGYNNQDIVFQSTTLPAGTYYYHVLPGVEEVNPETGFFLLKLDE